MVGVRWWWDLSSVRWFLCVRVERGRILVVRPTRHDVRAHDRGLCMSSNKENCLVLETFRDMS